MLATVESYLEYNPDQAETFAVGETAQRAKLTRYLNKAGKIASAMAEVYLDYGLTVETLDLHSGSRAILRRRNLWEITSISHDLTRQFTQTMDPGDYYADLESGILYFDTPLTPGERVLRVEYVAGYQDDPAGLLPGQTPEDLLGAVVDLTSWLMSHQIGVKAETTDGLQITRHPSFPPEVREICRAYGVMG